MKLEECSETGGVRTTIGPYSPIGRGNGLKIRTVWVRIPLRAQVALTGDARYPPL